jgi:hypothetical protein
LCFVNMHGHLHWYVVRIILRDAMYEKRYVVHVGPVDISTTRLRRPGLNRTTCME